MNSSTAMNLSSLPNFGNIRVALLIEDDPVSALLQKKILESEGYVTHLEMSVSGGLAYLKVNQPDMIVTDLNFPVEP